MLNVLRLEKENTLYDTARATPEGPHWATLFAVVTAKQYMAKCDESGSQYVLGTAFHHVRNSCLIPRRRPCRKA